MPRTKRTKNSVRIGATAKQKPLRRARTTKVKIKLAKAAGDRARKIQSARTKALSHRRS